MHENNKLWYICTVYFIWMVSGWRVYGLVITAWSMSWSWADCSWKFVLSSSLELLSLVGKSTKTNKKSNVEEKVILVWCMWHSVCAFIVCKVHTHFSCLLVWLWSYAASAAGCQSPLPECYTAHISVAVHFQNKYSVKVVLSVFEETDRSVTISKQYPHLFNERKPWPHLNCMRSDSAMALNPIQQCHKYSPHQQVTMWHKNFTPCQHSPVIMRAADRASTQDSWHGLP